MQVPAVLSYLAGDFLSQIYILFKKLGKCNRALFSWPFGKLVKGDPINVL